MYMCTCTCEVITIVCCVFRAAVTIAMLYVAMDLKDQSDEVINHKDVWPLPTLTLCLHPQACQFMDQIHGYHFYLHIHDLMSLGLRLL